MTERVTVVLPDDLHEKVDSLRKTKEGEIKLSPYLVYLIRRGVETTEKERKKKRK